METGSGTDDAVGPHSGSVGGMREVLDAIVPAPRSYHSGVTRPELPRTIDLHIPDIRLREAVSWLADRVDAAGGRALIVGGSVRDALLEIPALDIDVEVHGLEATVLQELIDERYGFDPVGRDFGILKVKGLDLDVALPRRESKRGLGHRGFEVHSDPRLGVEQAARRRDFTVNAMALDPRTGEILDPWGGREDLSRGVLRHVSDQFSEDPLRVLRAMQMAARFDLDPAPETVRLCRSITPEGLPRERIFEEWKKLILRGRTPSRGLAFLRDCGWLSETPELAALVDCPQDPEWHPEGDVWIHTLHVLDAFARHERSGEDEDDLVVGFACLCHDLGKPATTFEDETSGRIRSPGHEAEGEGPTRTFLARLTESDKLPRDVVPLVREHLKPIQLWKDGAGPAAIRRLAKRVGRIDRLVRLARADHRGRPPKPWDGFPAGEWLLERARQLRVEAEAPAPLVLGRHLIALGLAPGPAFGPILDAAFEAQLDGAFSTLEEGLEWVTERPYSPSGQLTK